jgi:hypothetical protein
VGVGIEIEMDSTSLLGRSTSSSHINVGFASEAHKYLSEKIRYSNFIIKVVLLIQKP